MVYRFMAAVGLLTFLFGAVSARADFLMGRYDPLQTSSSPEKVALPLAVKWQFDDTAYRKRVFNSYEFNGASKLTASAIVVKDMVYYAAGDRVYGIYLDTGAVKWVFPIDKPIPAYVRGTPAYSGGFLYFGTGDKRFYCIRADTGKLEWWRPTTGGVRCPAVVSDNTVYAGDTEGGLYAWNAATGAPLWPKPFDSQGDISVGLAVGSGMVIASTFDGNLLGLNASSGKLRWTQRLPVSAIDTSPIIVESTVILALGNAVYGLAVRSGAQRWFIGLPSEPASTPATDGQSLYVCTKDGKVNGYSISLREVRRKWPRPVDLRVPTDSSPVLCGNALFVVTIDGSVCALSPDDGRMLWRYQCGNVPDDWTLEPVPVRASPTPANGNLLIAGNDGILRCFTNSAPDSCAPKAYAVQPAEGSRTSSFPPLEMSMWLMDPVSGVDMSSVVVMLDGEVLTHEVDTQPSNTSYRKSAYNKVTCKTKDRIDDGAHKFKVMAKDYFGNVMSHEWSFTSDSSVLPPSKMTVESSTPEATTESGSGGSVSPNPNTGGNSGAFPPPPPPPPPPAPGPGETGPGGTPPPP